MPKITMKCVDCGKERTDYPPYFKKHGGKNYRCRKCINIITSKNNTFGKITKKCLDCGKERTAYPSDFKFCHGNDGYRCHKCAIKHFDNNRPPNSKITKKCIDCGKERTDWESNFKLCHGEEYRCKKCATINRSLSNQWKESRKDLYQNITWRENTKIANQKLHLNPSWKERHLIAMSGQGFWYGHPILNNPIQKYCEIFSEVKPRVRAFFNYTCTKCGKVETSKAFGVHHVFYEKKTCCWIDSTGHYWTNLNIQGHKRDYIGTDPNYFALLCDNCHGETLGKYEKRKNSANELRWLIDTKFGGKSYYTEEEMITVGYKRISKTKWEKI
jgi:hypothetical protein